MENKKLTKEELEQVQEIQNNLQAAQAELGKLEMQKYEIGNFVARTRQAEAEVAKTLEQKYGAGTIDITSGEFVPTQETQGVQPDQAE